MRKTTRVVLAVTIVALSTLYGPNASACSQFKVRARSPVTEGEGVAVKIERDSTAQPSSVNLRTADGSAKAKSDYKSTVMRVNFEAEQQKNITIPTIENTSRESTETFEIVLSGGQGCSSNPDFSYGSPASVTIKDDDGGLVTARPSTPKPTAAPPASTPRNAQDTPEPTPTESPTPEPTATALPTPSETPFAVATDPPVDEDDDDLSPLLVGLAVGAFVLAAGGAVALAQARRRAI